MNQLASVFIENLEIYELILLIISLILLLLIIYLSLLLFKEKGNHQVDDTSKKNNVKYETIWCWSLCVIFFIIFFYSFLIFLLQEKHEIRGTFGDMFGAVNALFSGLAFAGIIITLYFQRIELVHRKVSFVQNR